MKVTIDEFIHPRAVVPEPTEEGLVLIVPAATNANDSIDILRGLQRLGATHVERTQAGDLVIVVPTAGAVSALSRL